MSIKKTIGCCFSITVRPRNGITPSFDDINERLLKFVMSQKPDKYIFTIEEKEGPTSSHIQGAILYNDLKRQDNISRTIRRLFPKGDSDNDKMYKVVLHNDFKGLVGYCLKQNEPILCNLSKDVKAEASQYYVEIQQKVKESVPKSKGKNRIQDVNNKICYFWINFCRKLERRFIDYTYREILKHMLSIDALTPAELSKAKEESITTYIFIMDELEHSRPHYADKAKNVNFDSIDKEIEGRDILG